MRYGLPTDNQGGESHEACVSLTVLGGNFSAVQFGIGADDEGALLHGLERRVPANVPKRHGLHAGVHAAPRHVHALRLLFLQGAPAAVHQQS